MCAFVSGLTYLPLFSFSHNGWLLVPATRLLGLFFHTLVVKENLYPHLVALPGLCERLELK